MIGMEIKIMNGNILLGVAVLAACLSSCHLFRSSSNIKEQCPHIYERNFKGCFPKGNVTAGIFEEVKGVNKLKQCVLDCCAKDTCNVVFMPKDKCFHITCNSNELCIPTPSLNIDSSEHFNLILVKPTDDETWQEVLQQQEFSEDKEILDILNDRSRFENVFRDLLKEESFEKGLYCTIGLNDNCLPNEECVQQHPKSRSGTCECKDGFFRSEKGECVLLLLDESSLRPLPSIISERILSFDNKSIPVTQQPLIVNAESKEVRLPENEVTLFASVVPDNAEKYQFEWTSLHQPGGSTAVKHQNGGQLHLEKLIEGIYSFKVSASTPTAYGETFVNVTVLPAKRYNTPPTIIITPANQTIKQPNSAAVLDASSSTDDDGIVSWHWELQQGPLGYQPQLKDSPTLQLNDLTKPGNYTFRLTVTDSDNENSIQTANITVLAGTDYPPEANAGEDKIIYLPHNSITLSGNLSTDDHAITTWEWTKSADDAQKAVDMQDTRTPYLQLSNLQEGMYTFTLKVTDSANQSSTAQVHVFVKPPTNKPPVAVAGNNLTISLPQTWVVVDASNSTDDDKIISFKWEQVEGPSTVTFVNANATKTNVTGLTKGLYCFKVSVTDENKNVASDKVFVTVNQNKNQKPTADAGKDFSVELPKNVVILNGSDSKDDWAIVRWKWTRDDSSLALGNIAEKTDESPILILTDLAIGKYVFNLTVYDEQGLSDTDSVTFTVKNDPKLFYLVEITIDIDARSLTEAQLRTFKGKLALLIKDGSKLKVSSVRSEVRSSKTLLSFYIENAEGKPTPANEVVQYLRQKLRVDASLLGFTVTKLQTTICQNNCSGHGVCDEQTRECKCEAFWMQDMFKFYLGSDEDSDCSWSILYVVLGFVCGAIFFLGVLWGIVHLCYSLCSKRGAMSKPTTYKLIEDNDDLPPFASRKTNLSDSDTDSDVVFESRSKLPRFSDSRNGHKPNRNGYTKQGRRVKT
ncbi:dyslexia-associated protein KIAA0319-like protein isoform X1 [Leptinotarsa decemlineata]|uniref:dyslexia-associated protein KIAA0319-like protein isoform X1 n=2 Tax=Leptinotarsa decemlineata TaxID=7539 RepID=UPI003D309C42